jgi:hypothetical protein
MLRFALVTFLLLESASAFSAPEPQSGRRDFLAQIATVTAAATLSATAAPQPANALSGMKKVNSELTGYGLPTVAKVPDGMTPLLEIWGKGKNRFPLLVTFNHPLSWVVTVPSNNLNGEDGTIQAGEYGKGDTATLFVYLDAGKVKNINSQPKELFENALQKSIGQKGNNMFQNFKVTNLDPTSYENGQQYMVCDFKYTLLTGAGFEVDRKGVASVTSEGEAVEVLWTASTAIRYKKTEASLRDIAASFRCYADGIKVEDELYG